MLRQLINQKDSIEEGLSYVQDMVEGSMSILLMTPQGIYASRDKVGRTPIIIGEKSTGYCATFESSAFLNLGYHHYRDLGPGEIVFLTPTHIEVKKKPQEEMKICSSYGYIMDILLLRMRELMLNACVIVVERSCHNEMM